MRWSSGTDLVAKVFSPKGVDIGRRLVSAGVAYRRDSKDYVAADHEAKRGMWRGTFVKPWEWRVTVPPPQASTPSTPAGTRPRRDATAAGRIVQTFAR